MEGADLHIRPFTAADQAAARRLILDGLGEHFGFVDETCNPDLDDIAANVVGRGHLFLVAFIGVELVGTAALLLVLSGVEVFENARAGRIVRVSVERDHRRQGIGRALVARLVDAARARGLARLWMETNDDWTDTIAFYRRCGFVEYDRRAGNVYMALNLARN
jgi:ribosomal protein S18 acetylase RimI-like enzyme